MLEKEEVQARSVARKACFQISSELGIWEHSSLQSQWWETRKQVRPVSWLAKFTTSLTIKRKRSEQKGKHVQECSQQAGSPKTLSPLIITLFPPEMCHAKFWSSCLFETWKQNNNIYCWHLCIALLVLTIYFWKKHLSTSIYTCNFIDVLFKRLFKCESCGQWHDTAHFHRIFFHSVVDLLRRSLLNWLKKYVGTHLFPGLSKSRSFRTDLPSISGGVSSPAISRIVGARSIFRTIWGTLQINRKGHSCHVFNM